MTHYIEIIKKLEYKLVWNDRLQLKNSPEVGRIYTTGGGISNRGAIDIINLLILLGN